MSNNPSTSELQNIVYDSLRDLRDRDKFLLRLGVHERAIAHRLAIYLEHRLAGWDVDCEYNRTGGAVQIPEPQLTLAKRNSKRIDLNGGEPRRVFPDIIVHQRGEARNLLAIELKTSERSLLRENQRDRDKVREYIHDPQLGYRYGTLINIPIRLATDNPAQAFWYAKTAEATSLRWPVGTFDASGTSTSA